jgi:hypothetical protein
LPVLPPRPLVAFRAGAMSQRLDAAYIVNFSWFIYDDPVQGYWRINKLIKPIHVAYSAMPLPSVFGRLVGKAELLGPGPDLEDQALGLLFRQLRVAIPIL